LQNLDELERAAFIFCGPCAVACDISKPERNEMMT
jgi:hypothetical protein